MYNSPDCPNYHSVLSLNDERLAAVCKKYTNIRDSDIQKLIEVSHTLPVISELEGCDIFIDCLTRDNQYAVVVAQCSPPKNTFYNRDIVGEFMYRHNEPGVFRTLEIGVPSRELKAVVSENVLIRQNVSAIKSDDNRIIGVLIMERSMRSTSHVAEPAFPQHASSKKELYNIADHINEAMIHFNTMGISTFANENAKRLYQNIGYQDDIVGMSFDNLVLGEYTMDDVMQQRHIEHKEVTIGKYILNVVAATIEEDDQCLGVVLLIKDTTENKIKEKELILKSAAIDEIHHRVKNNLQTIVSLIRLQARRSASQEVRRVCHEIINRIFSISLTHEIMVQKGVDLIDVKEMLWRMINNTKSYSMPEGFDLEIELRGDSFYSQSDTATAIAMIVNELLQNSIKHGFVGRKEGRIAIQISCEGRYASIRIADNGVGLRQNHTQREESLGLKLVRNLVKDKLCGNMKIESSPQGTMIFFDFINDTEPHTQPLTIT